MLKHNSKNAWPVRFERFTMQMTITPLLTASGNSSRLQRCRLTVNSYSLYVLQGAGKFSRLFHVSLLIVAIKLLLPRSLRKAFGNWFTFVLLDGATA